MSAFKRWGFLGVALLVVLSLAVACGEKKADEAIRGCEGAPRPVVFVHGFMGAGDSFANAAMRFHSNGYCPAYLRAFDWNALSLDLAGQADTLADFVDGVLKETGAEQVDLVGHSMGGALSRMYLKDHADQVAHYVHAASFCGLTLPETLPLMTLSSDQDPVVGPCTIEGAENRNIDGADHLQVVTSPASFTAMYRFFNDGQEPFTTRVAPEQAVTLSGRLVAFGTNQPAAEATVAIYPLEAATGERLGPDPVARFTAADDGAWGPFEADPAVYYEFKVTAPGARPLHYYRQPFTHSNDLVYLRVLPKANPLLDQILGSIRYDDAGGSLVLFSANQALYHGRDTLTLDDLDLATPEMAPPPPSAVSTIAIFVFDADGDGQTDGGPLPVQGTGLSFLPRDGAASDEEASEFPFLRQYDAFMDASARRTLTLTMNGATLHAPTWKGDSEGVIIVVFDYGQDGL